jgi:hypothetical protein
VFTEYLSTCVDAKSQLTIQELPHAIVSLCNEHVTYGQ